MGRAASEAPPCAKAALGPRGDTWTGSSLQISTRVPGNRASAAACSFFLGSRVCEGAPVKWMSGWHFSPLDAAAQTIILEG